MKAFLEIEKGDDDAVVPKKYHKINNLCAIIYDQITEIYTAPNYSDLNSTSINLEGCPELQDKFKGHSKNEKVLDWLKEYDKTDELESVLSKNLLLAITSDFINFVFESLHTAKRGKMTVAYALIRKPISDSLLLLEQLFVDKKDFIERFYHDGDPLRYDPSEKKLDKLSITKQAVAKIRIRGLFDANHIHDLRYNKEIIYGLNGITNHAIHIVTKDKNYKTENQSLNFVFSNKKDFHNQLKHYYNIVPYLLLYSVSIIDGIVFEILKDSDNQKLRVIKEFRRVIGLVLLAEYIAGKSKKSIPSIFKYISDNLVIDCKECGNKNKIERADCELFFKEEILMCTNCFNNILSTDHAVSSIDNIIQKLAEQDN